MSRKGTFGVRGSPSRSARLHDSRAGTPESQTSWVRCAICETVAGEGRPRRGEGSRPRDHADPRSAAVSRAEEEEGLTSLRETSCVRARCSLVEDRRRVAAIRTEATPKTKKKERARGRAFLSLRPRSSPAAKVHESLRKVRGSYSKAWRRERVPAWRPSQVLPSPLSIAKPTY